jgi:sensor histidine kinase YesM
VGLKNVERRLRCHYGTAGSLSIQSVLDVGTTVRMRLPIPASVTDAHDREEVTL